MSKKIFCVFGTRPEAIKMASVVKELQKYPGTLEPVICVTAQHRQMLDQVLSLFDIKPDIDLNLMEPNQTLESLTAKVLLVLSQTLKEHKPDAVLVQGDTTTAMAAGLASFYLKIPVGHVEAGLRTKDIYNPFPEEINRKIIGALASLHFAPTRRSFQTLLDEGTSPEKVFMTGNTVVDALYMTVAKNYAVNNHIEVPPGHRLILITAHRRENFGKPLENICNALAEILRKYPDVDMVYPVHLNPNVKEPVHRILGQEKRMHLIPPVEYHELVDLMKKSYMVLTDSGGIQEEAPSLGKPVLVMRKETERPEGVDANVVKLVGTEFNDIVTQTELLLNDKNEYEKMSKAVSPYGDGKAAERIVSILKQTIK
jgi:UDP-N-acetylglucosamine 2-epimerase (non-hydrolysing)